MVTIIKQGASKKEIKSLLEHHSKKKTKKGIDLNKFCGIINIPEDPMELQKKWRDEWE
jgi:hypothetical protein